jgi:hypothetical protein
MIDQKTPLQTGIDHMVDIGRCRALVKDMDNRQDNWAGAVESCMEFRYLHGAVLISESLGGR